MAGKHKGQKVIGRRKPPPGLSLGTRTQGFSEPEDDFMWSDVGLFNPSAREKREECPVKLRVSVGLLPHFFDHRGRR